MKTGNPVFMFPYFMMERPGNPVAEAADPANEIQTGTYFVNGT